MTMDEREHKPEPERIVEVSVEDEMKTSYIDYAMSVIVGRALPDARDGLKPVHRRILYAMHELGLTRDKPHKKSARIVGEVLGKYHPHGDVAVYDTMVRMAQDFSCRYPLIDGQGNFGSVDGDTAAAMRYTEARFSKIAEELLTDIEKNTVSWSPNFDNSLKEPLVLPAKLPNLLINGSSGIAVGMATNMPPHNLTEVVDGIINLIDAPEVSIEELTGAIKAPDFPTGGIILGFEGIKKAYETGRGSIRIRSEVEIEKKGKKERIVIKEIPYQVNKSKLVEEIAEFVRKNKVESITGLRDESDREGMRIVIELKTGANSSILLNNLYKHTQMETSFGVINLALVDGEPRVLTLKELCQCYLEHRKEVTVKRLQYELERAERRKHILEGLIIAVSNIEEVIKLIKASRDSKNAKEALISRFGLDEEQVKEILEMKLSRLSALERDKIENEQKEKEEKIKWLKEVLSSEERIFELIKEELRELKGKYGDERRTKIEEKVELSERDFIEEEEVFLFFTERGYVKRIPEATFKRQRRGGKGVGVIDKKEGDALANFIRSSTRERLILFTEHGKAYQAKTYEILTSSRHAKGKALVNIQSLRGLEREEREEKEKIKSIIPIPEDIDRDLKAKPEDFFFVFATKKGIVKKSPLASFKYIRSTGITAIKIGKEDTLAGVALQKKGEAIVICTRNGKVILFHEHELRELGRYAIGVRGMRLEKDDEVTSIDTVDIGSDSYSSVKAKKRVITITEDGFGKRTRVDAYRETHRGGKGVIGIKVGERNGKAVCIKAIKDSKNVVISTSNGMIIEFSANNIPTQGRNTQGVRLMNVRKGEKVVAMEVF